MGPYAMILVFLMLSFKPAFSTLLFYPPQEEPKSLLMKVKEESEKLA